MRPSRKTGGIALSEEGKRVILKQSRACRLAFLISEVSSRPTRAKKG